MIDLDQMVHARVKIDGMTDDSVMHEPLKVVLRNVMLLAQRPDVLWRGKGTKNITIQISNQPIKNASELTKVDEIAAGLEFDMTIDEWEAQQALRLSEGEPLYPSLANDPKMVRLIHINQTKSGFENSLPAEIQELLSYAKTTYPAWFRNIFQKKYIP